MVFVVIRLIYVDFKCRGSNGVGYCPLLVLSRNRRGAAHITSAPK